MNIVTNLLGRRVVLKFEGWPASLFPDLREKRGEIVSIYERGKNGLCYTVLVEMSPGVLRLHDVTAGEMEVLPLESH